MAEPNLTLEKCGGEIIQKDNEHKERYKSLTQCSLLRSIPITALSAAKNSEPLPHHGFLKNGVIQWDVLQPWFQSNYERFLEEINREDDELGRLQLKKLKQEVIKLENFNKTKSKDFISRKLVLKTINSLYGNVFTQLSRYLEFEMPSKCDGMSSVQLKQYNKDFLIRLLSGLKNQEKLWLEADDMAIEESEVKPE